MLNWSHSEYSVTLCGSNSTARTTDQMFNNKADPNNLSQHRAANGAGASWKGGMSARENASVMRNAGGLITPLVAALIVVIGLLLPARAEQITLAWDYPTNELAGVTFRVRYANDITIPLTNWVVLIATTNTQVRLDVPRGVNFFTCSASNFWGESVFSNVASTPPVVKTNVPLTITRP